MSKKFKDWEYEQVFLFPPSVKDFVPDNHVSHFVRSVVCERLDLRAIMNDYVEDRGAPPFHPAMMTALLLYAYCQGIRSSRKIARGCEERVDFMVVSGMKKPDFRTVNKFRLRHIGALEGLFGQVVQLCQEAGLVNLGHVALDGTKIKASAAQSTSWKYCDIKEEQKKIRDDIKRWFREAEDIDEEEDRMYGKDKRGDELPDWVNDKQELSRRLKAAQESLEKKQKGKAQGRREAEKSGKKPNSHKRINEVPNDTQTCNLTDPESALLKSGPGFIQGYNAQAAVDRKTQIVVACNASTQADVDEFVGMVAQVKRICGKAPKELSADAGYCCEHNLKLLKREKITGYIAASRDRDAGLDKTLRRNISRGTLVYKMYLKLRRAGRRTRYRLRKSTVETFFGITKAARGFRQFLLRGEAKVRAEWSLVCMAHNLRKLSQAA